jgi:hypothetical protein
LGHQWNACQSSFWDEDDGFVCRFSTAWSVPVPVFEKLGEMFPALDFELDGEEILNDMAYEGSIKKGRLELRKVPFIHEVTDPKTGETKTETIAETMALKRSHADGIAWLASRKEAGRKVDVETCEVVCWVADYAHPYGIREVDGVLQPAENEYTDKYNFVRSPETDGWVCEGDLPQDKAIALMQRIERDWPDLHAPEGERSDVSRAPREISDAALSPGKREIVLDIKTTGANPQDGHRLISVGCVELVNNTPSGYTFRAYCNPERGMPAEAFAAHGLSEAYLKDKPCFAEIADDLIVFLGDTPLIIDGASVAFGSGFLNAELERAGRSPIACERFVEGAPPF